MSAAWLGVLALVAGLCALRWWMVRDILATDAARPRTSSGVIRGAEGFAFERAGAPAVLLIHGAGDTPQTLLQLGAFLHERGFAVAAPVLPGHATSVRDFRHVTSAAWRAAALGAYDELAATHEWVAIAGLSMGGALAVLTAAERPATPAVVLMAPYLALPPGLRITAAISRLIGLVMPYAPSLDTRSIRDPEAAARGLAYGAFTPAALRALRATAEAAFAALGRVRAPTLIIQSERDNRVAPDVARRSIAALGCAEKRLEWVSDGGHVITVDYGKERVFTLAAEWLIAHGPPALLRS